MIKRTTSFIIFAVLLLLSSRLTIEVGGTGQLGDIFSDGRFIDDVGNEIIIEKPVRRLISLSQVHTENIYSLGAEALLIGVDQGSNYPFETQALPMYRLDKKLDQEALIQANPDMVLIDLSLDETNRALIGQIEKAGIPVVALMPSSIDDFGHYMTKLGIITGLEEKAYELTKEFYTAIKVFESKTNEGPSVFVEGSERNHRTPTQHTLVIQAIQLAGGQQIVPESHWFMTSDTMVPCSNTFMNDIGPLVDVYMSLHGDGYTGPTKASVLQQTLYQNMKAVKEGRIYELESPIVSRYTMRYLKGIKELRRLLYGDEMAKTKVLRSDVTLTREHMATMIYERLTLPTFIMNDQGYYTHQKYHHTYGSFEDVHWDEEAYDAIETVVMKGYLLPIVSNGIARFKGNVPVSEEDLSHFLYQWKDVKAEDINSVLSDKDIHLQTIDTVGEFTELMEVMTLWP